MWIAFAIATDSDHSDMIAITTMTPRAKRPAASHSFRMSIPCCMTDRPRESRKDLLTELERHCLLHQHPHRRAPRTAGLEGALRAGDGLARRLLERLVAAAVHLHTPRVHLAVGVDHELE